MTINKLLLVYFVLFFSSMNLFAQNYGTSSYYSFRHSIGATLLESHSESNPAALALDTTDYIIISSKPSRFGISELTPFLLISSIAIDSNRIIGANISGIGGNLYSELSAELKFSQRLGQYLMFGASYEYSRLSIKNYGLESIGIINIGAVLSLSSNLKAGFYLRNLLRNYIENSDKTIYQQSVVGLSYNINPELVVETDASIIINSNSSFGIGFKYSATESIAVRTAFRTNPELIEVAVLAKVFNETYLLLGFDYNNILGISPEIAVKYAF